MTGQPQRDPLECEHGNLACPLCDSRPESARSRALTEAGAQAFGVDAPRRQSDLCCTVYDVQCICWPDCRCRCKGCKCGPLIRREAR